MGRAPPAPESPKGQGSRAHSKPEACSPLSLQGVLASAKSRPLSAPGSQGWILKDAQPHLPVKAQTGQGQGRQHSGPRNHTDMALRGPACPKAGWQTFYKGSDSISGCVNQIVSVVLSILFLIIIL